MDLSKLNLDPATLEKIGIAVLQLVIGLILGPLVRSLIMRISRKVWDKGAMTFIGSFANVAIIVIAIIIAMDTLGINTNVLVSAFSALGLGISLALKDNMANVAGGLQILITRPFVVGDYVVVGSHEGYIRGIELMYTTLETFSNEEVIVPNAKMISKIVVNHSKDPVRRLDLKIPVFRYNDVREIENVLKDIIEKDPRVLKKPAYTITVDKIRTKFMDIVVYVYCQYEDYWDLCYDLYNEISIALKDINPYILEVAQADKLDQLQAEFQETVKKNDEEAQAAKADPPETPQQDPKKKESLLEELITGVLDDKQEG